MYTTCLFCHGALGTNEAIEHFPVGRRLAFDAAKGRLWVVCRRCERWNLTPLEERWEAIEECERAYCAVRTRVSTGNIGLARLAEGLELVRIGQPLRPEMAAWRYGDQFGRRRLRGGLAVAGSAVGMGAAMLAAPAVLSAGLAVGGMIGALTTMSLLWVPSYAVDLIEKRRSAGAGIRVALGNGEALGIAPADYGLVQLLQHGDDARLLVVSAERTRTLLNDRLTSAQRETHTLHGADIMRVLGALLPRTNRLTGGVRNVRRAVDALEAAPSPERLLRDAAAEAQRHYDTKPVLQLYEQGALATIPAPLRLALEMAAHEEQERRALEGELAELERAWRAAEEVAGIADGMLVPDAVERGMTRLKGQSGDTPGRPAA
jgi:fructose-specific component phosphotransferase system IIB-like protein